MQNLFPLIFIAFIVYLMVFKKGGGMGCCGGHMEPGPGRHDNDNRNPVKPIHGNAEQVIELREDQYTVIESEDEKLPRT